MAVHQLKDGRWIVRYRKGTNPEDPGRTREYFGRGAAAEAAARARDKELGFGRRKLAAPKPSGPLFSELVIAYMLDKKFNPNSRRHLGIRLTAHLLPFFGHMVATRITHRDCQRYVKARRDAHRTVIDRDSIRKCKVGGKKQAGRRSCRPIADATIARELTDLKAIMRWAYKQDPPLIPFDPVRDFQKPTPARVDIRLPTAAETKAILKAAPPHLVRFVKLGYYLGLRPGAVELLRLTWDAVNWDTGSIDVVSAEKGGMVRRQVPIHDSFAGELRQWWREDGGEEARQKPIIHYRGRAVRRVQTAWENTLTRAKIRRRIRPYDLRHHFITTALEEGADIGAVASIVGSSPETLRKHYQHVTNRFRRQTVNLIKPIEEDIQEEDAAVR